MAFQHVNNFETILSSSLATGATTANIPTADAAVLEAKSPSGSDPIQLTIFDGTNMEIVQCTAANGSTGDLTIVREQEGTTSPASFAAGTNIYARITAAMLDSYVSGGGGGGPTLVDEGNLTSSNSWTMSANSIHYGVIADNTAFEPLINLDVSGITGYAEFSTLVKNDDATYGDHFVSLAMSSTPSYWYYFTDPVLDDTTWSYTDVANPYEVRQGQTMRYDFSFNSSWSFIFIKRFVVPVY